MDSAFLKDTVVNLAESGSGGDPSRVRGYVDGDVAEVRHVEDENEDGGADVAIGARSDDDGGFGGGGSVEPGVSDVSGGWWSRKGWSERRRSWRFGLVGFRLLEKHLRNVL
ncbi:hypothetical protein Bca52824_094811 [Brassica carinata]|uniref:Uncharacterized protein n=1 Tax=Brassica carinata TaxID=52824 RepID=A0A8X7TJF6_BRACI|nr:hypothetical protein Bca52824_094811 [Brassica carinata]